MSKKKKKTNPKAKNRRKPKANKQKQELLRRHNRAQRELVEVYRLLDREEWDEAREMLEALHARYPKSTDVLYELVNLAYDTDDMHSYLKYVRLLHPLVPTDGDMALGLAGGYMASMYPFAAYHYKLKYLEKFPDHERAEDVRESMADMEKVLARLLVDLGAEGEEGYELGYLHDLLRVELAMGDRKAGLRIGHQLLKKFPTFAPAYNNLSQIEFTQGDSENALDYARHVLELDPDNFQASSNLARYLYLLGRVEEANAQGDDLASLQSDKIEILVKKAEAFTYLNHPERVDAAVRESAKYANLHEIPDMGLLYHLGAVAALNMGDEKLARARWKLVNERDPVYPLVELNLDDLKRAEYKRHGPTPFSNEQWLPNEFWDDLKKIVERSAKSRRSEEEKDARIRLDFQRYFDQRPRLMHLFNCILERGDQEGRDNIFGMAHVSEYPPLLEILKQFGLSQYGSDESRLQAIEIAQRYGHISSGTIRLWLEGEWLDTFSFGFEIGDESEIPFPITNSEAQEAYVKSVELMRAGKPQESIQWLEKADQLQPNHPMILNNLSACYEQLDEYDKALAVREDIFEKTPDYLFGQISFVNQAVLDGDLERAEEILAPLLGRRKLHYSEFSAVSDSQVRILVAKGEIDRAREWVKMWRNVAEDDRKLAEWEDRMALSDRNLKRFAKGAIKKLTEQMGQNRA